MLALRNCILLCLIISATSFAEIENEIKDLFDKPINDIRFTDIDSKYIDEKPELLLENLKNQEKVLNKEKQYLAREFYIYIDVRDDELDNTSFEYIKDYFESDIYLYHNIAFKTLDNCKLQKVPESIYDFVLKNIGHDIHAARLFRKIAKRSDLGKVKKICENFKHNKHNYEHFCNLVSCRAKLGDQSALAFLHRELNRVKKNRKKLMVLMDQIGFLSQKKSLNYLVPFLEYEENLDYSDFFQMPIANKCYIIIKSILDEEEYNKHKLLNHLLKQEEIKEIKRRLNQSQE
ncbi:hypothetical protein GF354_04200 [Candidatus Peregrinibacteria bacterium]|nr:hypothetical protein [Candidatus Peregrinibacteria bacterium]